MIKQRDGDIARLQQKLEHLEQLLIDQEWARNALVFYQLRGMNQRCQNRLGNFAEQLKQQREKRQYGQAMEQWQAKQAAETKAVDDKISTLRAERLQLEDQLKAMNRQLSDMNGVSRPVSRAARSAGTSTILPKRSARRSRKRQRCVNRSPRFRPARSRP